MVPNYFNIFKSPCSFWKFSETPIPQEVLDKKCIFCYSMPSAFRFFQDPNPNNILNIYVFHPDMFPELQLALCGVRGEKAYSENKKA